MILGRPTIGGRIESIPPEAIAAELAKHGGAGWLGYVAGEPVRLLSMILGAAGENGSTCTALVVAERLVLLALERGELTGPTVAVLQVKRDGFTHRVQLQPMPLERVLERVLELAGELEP